MSKADGGGMEVEVEPSHQYPNTRSYHVTDGEVVSMTYSMWK